MSTSSTGPTDVTPPTPISQGPCLLTVNGGSSSLKFAVYEIDSAARGSPRRTASGMVDRIGLADARMTARRVPDQKATAWNVEAPDLAAAADLLIDWIDQSCGGEKIAGAGFRIVHGGPRVSSPGASDSRLARRAAPDRPAR